MSAQAQSDLNKLALIKMLKNQTGQFRQEVLRIKMPRLATNSFVEKTNVPKWVIGFRLSQKVELHLKMLLKDDLIRVSESSLGKSWPTRDVS